MLCVGDDSFAQQRSRNNRGHALDLGRGVLSHVRAQANNLQDFVRDSALGQVDWVFAANVFDDAAMWVSKAPNYDAERAKHSPNDAANSIKKALARKGRNVHIAVLNCVETLMSGAP